MKRRAIRIMVASQPVGEIMAGRTAKTVVARWTMMGIVARQTTRIVARQLMKGVVGSQTKRREAMRIGRVRKRWTSTMMSPFCEKRRRGHR